jgi:hypothetical protein
LSEGYIDRFNVSSKAVENIALLNSAGYYRTSKLRNDLPKKCSCNV